MFLLMATLFSRSHVWTEAQFLEQAASDFSETESMLKTAEDLCGPYVWGEYSAEFGSGRIRINLGSEV